AMNLCLHFLFGIPDDDGRQLLNLTQPEVDRAERLRQSVVPIPMLQNVDRLDGPKQDWHRDRTAFTSAVNRSSRACPACGEDVWFRLADVFESALCQRHQHQLL